MEKGRTSHFLCGHSPGASLPHPIFSLAIAAVLCCQGCQSLERVHPDPPAAAVTIPPEGGRADPADGFRIGIDIDAGGLRGETENGTRGDDWWLIRRLDLFVFDDDALRALDSYTRSYAYSPSSVTVCSAGGPKRVVAVANLSFADDYIATVRCYDDLRDAVTEFTADHPSWPVMSGETAFTASPGAQARVTLEPMMSTVEIRSLQCRMEGEYAGKTLKGVKVYLTDLSNRAPLLREEGFLPSEILNAGGLSESDLGRLAYSGMVYRYLGDGTADGTGTRYGSAVLYCYPDEAPEASPASPFTRLVIEGTQDGTPCRYSIPVNRAPFARDGPEGIGRNSRYVFDITLTRPGTGSPDDIGLFSP